MNDVTQLLSALDPGDPHATGRLLPLVYDELRKLAAQRMAQEQPGQTLQPTTLVHELTSGWWGGGIPAGTAAATSSPLATSPATATEVAIRSAESAFRPRSSHL
jgi:hypothetical protein